ncbi:hypothetical protein Tco_0449675 [Tanacetum coccineum]
MWPASRHRSNHRSTVVNDGSQRWPTAADHRWTTGQRWLTASQQPGLAGNGPGQDRVLGRVWIGSGLGPPRGMPRGATCQLTWRGGDKPSCDSNPRPLGSIILVLKGTNDVCFSTYQKSRPSRLRRLRKVGTSRRVESSNNASLGAQEDASKQGRKIEDLDTDAEVTLVNETQEMNDDNLMFDTGVSEEQEIKFEKVVEEPVVSVATTTKSIPVSAAEV